MAICSQYYMHASIHAPAVCLRGYSIRNSNYFELFIVIENLYSPSKHGRQQ